MSTRQANAPTAAADDFLPSQILQAIGQSFALTALIMLPGARYRPGRGLRRSGGRKTPLVGDEIRVGQSPYLSPRLMTSINSSILRRCSRHNACCVTAKFVRNVRVGSMLLKKSQIARRQFSCCKKSGRRPPIDVAPITLPRSPASLSSGNEVPHIFTVVQDRDFVIEYRYGYNRLDRLAEVAAELVDLKVDVLVTVGTLAPLALKRATSTIPIVLTSGGDPVGSGLVDSLARPGGNVTGLSLMVPDLGGVLRGCLTA
jgi:ABC transporter substrate binding protein